MHRYCQSGSSYVALHACLLITTVVNVNVFLDFIHVQMCDFGILAIEDLGEFLERGATSFDIEEVDEEEFKEDPYGVECA